MTHIYIIRHAEAEGNIYRRIHGHYNSRITTNGERQIDALRRRFAQVPIDAVYASDLYRTCRTAQALCEPKGLVLHKDARFREVYFGRWEDLPFGHLAHFEPELMRQFNTDLEHLQVDGAEQFAQLTGRFINALTELSAQNDGKTIAIFTHGCVSDHSLSLMFGDVPRQNGHCDNTGVSLLHYSNGSFTYSYFYDNSHLTPELSTLAHQQWWRGKKDYNLWFRPACAQDTALFAPEFLPPSNHTTQIAMLSDMPVGYISTDLRGSAPSVSCMYLLPQYRHLRMGDQLLGCVVSAARQAGADTLVFGVPTQLVEAMSFLSRHGACVEQMDDLFTVLRLPISVPVL